MYDLAKNQEKVTISFSLKTSKTGVYTIALIHYDQSDTNNKESFIQEFEITEADTFQKIEVTFDLSQLQYTLTNNEEKEFELFLCAYSNDTTIQGQNGYNDGWKVTTANAVQLTSSDYIILNELQLEKGEFATEFERLPYEVQLDRCLRFYETMTPGNSDLSSLRAYKVSKDASTADDFWQYRYFFRKEKRSSPIVKTTFNTTVPYYNPDRLNTLLIEYTNDSGHDGGFEVHSILLDAEIY